MAAAVARRKFDPDKPLGATSPWAWAIEPVRGCNLRCGHCATRLFERKRLDFMSRETWECLWRIIRAVTPKCRVEMANAGEPTLHPELLDFLWIARRLSPTSQIQITTNGTMLEQEKLTYRQLFKAGANIVYVDMYAPEERHEALARASGFPYYFYNRKPDGAKVPNAWTFHDDPSIKFIVLMDNPANWPEKRKRLGRLGTFLNHLDWAAAKRFGLTPVREPIKRRCSQPLKYVSVHQNGSYELCCQDFFGESVGHLGSVHEGVEGFRRFWYGQIMQDIRRKLDRGDRAGCTWCSRCNITFSRCDMRLWPAQAFEHFWDGKEWVPMPPETAGASPLRIELPAKERA